MPVNTITNNKIAIGLMSGTSMDGIDAAVIESDGQNHIKIFGHYALEYDDAFRQKLKKCLKDAEKIIKREDRPEELAIIERELTQKHSLAVKKLLEITNQKAENIDIIGFHGQTILHRPEVGLTVQLGDGALLAKECGIDVVYDMRQNDMLHGGQGAPLIPAYHRGLAHKLLGKVQYPVAFVNIGGIANLTWLDKNNQIYAFDCGPGNALIDQWMTLKTGEKFDHLGKTALKGKIHAAILQSYQDHVFFHQDKPTSLDWRSFKPLDNEIISKEDGAATLSYLTAFGIIHALRYVPKMPKSLIISGGGAKNLAILAALKELSANFDAEILNAKEIGLNPDFMEAEAWGYLAIRALYKLPLTYPTTTNCNAPVSGGVFVPSIR